MWIDDCGCSTRTSPPFRCEHALGGNKELADRRACGIPLAGPGLQGDREWIWMEMKVEMETMVAAAVPSASSLRVTSNKQAAVVAIEMLLQVTESADNESSAWPWEQ